MIKIEKTYGVRGLANDKTFIRLQELIHLYNAQLSIGKVKIDTEQLTFYKFMLKVGLARFATNGLVVNEDGIIRDCSLEYPIIYDKQVLKSLYDLFNVRFPFAP